MKSNLRTWMVAALMASLWLAPAFASAQSDDDNTPSLGDVARALRRDKEAKEKTQPEVPSTQTVIDNDNLSKVMEQTEKARVKNSMKFVFDGLGKDISVSAPDVTCNLSFSAKSGSLVSDPFVPQDLPGNELAKLDGPAFINGSGLQVTVHNGTAWTLREITVSLTILRPNSPSAAARFGDARLLPAAASEDEPAGKPSDFTMLYHIKGAAAPFTTAVFRQDLGGNLDANQEWHWAIVQAQGIPPK